MAEKKYLLKEYDNSYKELQISHYCDKAKEIFLGYLVNKYFSDYYLYLSDTSKLTPIEQIFEISYKLYIKDFYSWNQEVEDIEKFIPISIQMIFNESLEMQKEIKYKDNKYIADFVINFDIEDNCKEKNFFKFQKLKYIIELDGFEYHSNKKQVNYDYERERNLQELGYKIIRFTGSQIYNKPFCSIDELFKIILNDIRREIYGK